MINKMNLKTHQICAMRKYYLKYLYFKLCNLTQPEKKTWKFFKNYDKH